MNELNKLLFYFFCFFIVWVYTLVQGVFFTRGDSRMSRSLPVVRFFEGTEPGEPHVSFLDLIPTGPAKDGENCFFHFSGGAIQNVQLYRETSNPDMILLQTNCFRVFFLNKFCFVKDFFYLAREDDPCHLEIQLPSTGEYKSPAAYVMDFILVMAALFRCTVIELEDVATKKLKNCKFPLYLNKYRPPFRSYYGQWGFIANAEIKHVVDTNTAYLKVLKRMQLLNQVVAERPLKAPLPSDLYAYLIPFVQNFKTWTPQLLCTIISTLCDKKSDNKVFLKTAIAFLQKHYPENPADENTFKSTSTHSTKYMFYQDSPFKDTTNVKSCRMQNNVFIETFTGYTWEFSDRKEYSTRVYTIHKTK